MPDQLVWTQQGETPFPRLLEVKVTLARGLPGDPVTAYLVSDVQVGEEEVHTIKVRVAAHDAEGRGVLLLEAEEDDFIPREVRTVASEYVLELPVPELHHLTVWMVIGQATRSPVRGTAHLSDPDEDGDSLVTYFVDYENLGKAATRVQLDVQWYRDGSFVHRSTAWTSDDAVLPGRQLLCFTNVERHEDVVGCEARLQLVLVHEENTGWEAPVLDEPARADAGGPANWLDPDDDDDDTDAVPVAVVEEPPVNQTAAFFSTLSEATPQLVAPAAAGVVDVEVEEIGVEVVQSVVESLETPEPLEPPPPITRVRAPMTLVPEAPVVPDDASAWDLVEAGQLDEALARFAAEGLDPAGQQTVARMIGDSDPGTITLALRIARAGGYEGAAYAIRPLLRHPHAVVRVEACKAIGQLGRASMVTLVRPLTNDAEASVRKAATDAMRALTR